MEQFIYIAVYPKGLFEKKSQVFKIVGENCYSEYTWEQIEEDLKNGLKIKIRPAREKEVKQLI